MENYKAKEGQTLYDVIIACYGSLDYVVKFCYDNDLSAFDLIETGREYYYDETVGDFTITKTFEKQQSSPNNAQTPPEPDFYFKMSGDVYFQIPEMQWNDAGIVEIDRSFETNQLFNPTGFNDFYPFIEQENNYSEGVSESTSSGTSNGVAYLSTYAGTQTWRNILLTKSRQKATYTSYKMIFQDPKMTAGSDSIIPNDLFTTGFKVGRVKDSKDIDTINVGFYGVKFFLDGELVHNYRATKEGVLKDEITGASLSPINNGGSFEIVQYSEYTQPAKTGDIIADFEGDVIVDTGIVPNTNTIIKALIRNPYRGYNGNKMFGTNSGGDTTFYVNDRSWGGGILSDSTEIISEDFLCNIAIGGTGRTDYSDTGIEIHSEFVELVFGSSVGITINGVEKIAPIIEEVDTVDKICIGGTISVWDYATYGYCQIKRFDVYENGEAGGLTKSFIPSSGGCLIDQDNKKYFPVIGKDKINILYENE